ncbi:hypothetical protein Y032_0096g2915 [Ancylostoma ceylanicum]|uniref:Uncharacterized protein n=1 Tax=Ancylostoma ceylanicum TaxID=53326 RepID=A0A016TK94_9BILA|nr:hypothetical protein Y032_0096g2915 [Ancylostoma ceylanicum]
MQRLSFVRFSSVYREQVSLHGVVTNRIDGIEGRQTHTLVTKSKQNSSLRNTCHTITHQERRQAEEHGNRHTGACEGTLLT